ncbi:chemotaxis protein CheW [Chitinimonas sp. BJB300]|uniref:chemotaxis protein CheW n=1 Tax=Chitinimonas sp. BJB300 TaxID=1559339 RepID=UPI000C0DC4F2|nr:chemotaxis protein CheW [Chitinimonas sp. BJB300]PHV09606.1 chemotaxis protein CheW [Chitinimonas sp. BJB300]TSJ86069.1 chemotaxis protein CheW [Chitinimonas sp. BJB300]
MTSNRAVNEEHESRAERANRNEHGKPQKARHCVTFELVDEVFAIEIHHIREIIEYEGVTTVPLMPAFLRGIINLRGSVVPVIDLSVRFGRPPTAIKPTTCIAILSLGNGQGTDYTDIGVMLDSVREVVEIPESDIDPAPSLGSRMRDDFINGITTVSGRFAIILDVTQVLLIEELGELAEIQLSGMSSMSAG